MNEDMNLVWPSISNNSSLGRHQVSINEDIDPLNMLILHKGKGIQIAHAGALSVRLFNRLLL